MDGLQQNARKTLACWYILKTLINTHSYLFHLSSHLKFFSAFSVLSRRNGPLKKCEIRAISVASFFQATKWPHLHIQHWCQDNYGQCRRKIWCMGENFDYYIVEVEKICTIWWERRYAAPRNTVGAKKSTHYFETRASQRPAKI